MPLWITNVIMQYPTSGSDGSAAAEEAAGARESGEACGRVHIVIFFLYLRVWLSSGDPARTRITRSCDKGGGGADDGGGEGGSSSSSRGRWGPKERRDANGAYENGQGA